MFVFTEPTTFPWKIEADTMDENGNIKQESFTAIYNRVPQERVEILIGLRTPWVGKEEEELTDQDKADREFALNKTDKDILKEVLHGWREDLVDGDEKPVPPTEENKAIFISRLGVAKLLVEKWMEALSKVTVKNSKAPQSTGVPVVH